MILEDLIGGTSGGGGLNPLTISSQVFTASGTFVAPKTGKYIVICSGGGGSGAASYNADGYPSGGEGGEITHGIIDLIAAENVTVTIGSGGAALINATDTHGNTGGTTTFGGYLTALGGGGGLIQGSTARTYTNTKVFPSKNSTKGGYGNRSFHNGDGNYQQTTKFVDGEDLCVNFYGLLSVYHKGGLSSTPELKSTTLNEPICGGGGAGIGGKGGDGQDNNTTSNFPPAVGYGAGSGGVCNTSAAYRNTAAGGDGIVYIFWEA